MLLRINGRVSMNYRNRLLIAFKSIKKVRRALSNKNSTVDDRNLVTKIRNIGIMAHIDAGKTTTTERMLFYSGFSRILGDVDDGDTIMDYMEEERERGITITSAAITFNWNHHRINLIDTPGHVDFTMEVERSLRVLDGAVTILDAAAGVEAQTVTVWHQANRYKIPRIIYLNKMDKSRANIDMCIRAIEQKLQMRPLVMQLPLSDGNSKFNGVIDLVSMTKFEWLISDDPSGRVYKKTKLNENLNGELWSLATQQRRRLVELIADLDDSLAEKLLMSENPDTLGIEDLEQALRRITLSNEAVLVFCGSSYKNTGVQLLLDAVVKFLPSPNDVWYQFIDFYKGNLCSLVFKIIHDKHKGRLTFVRLYSGSLKRGQSIYNASSGVSEKISKLYVVYADEFEEVDAIEEGNIAVLTGLTSVRTGDTIVGSHKAASDALKTFRKVKGDVEFAGNSVLAGVEVPQPVFFCSIEPASLSQQTALEKALETIQVEDPSVKVSTDHDTGQTILAGMGELHIEIIKHRLEREFKLDVDLGSLQVAYHETIGEKVELKHVLDKSLGNTKHHVVIHLSINPQKQDEFTGVKVAVNRETRENIDNLKAGQLDAVSAGVKSALSHGPLLGYPVTNVEVWIHWCEVGSGTSMAMIMAAAAQCVTKMLTSIVVKQLKEPVMKLEIVTNERGLNSVLADLSSRRSDILDVFARGDAKIVSALAPLDQLINYATSLRIITSGTAVFTMGFHCYQLMTVLNQQKAIEKVTGFATRN